METENTIDNKTQTPLDQINETIKSTLSSSTDKVKNLVIDGFVNVEVNRRADLLSKLVTAINTFNREGNKIKPDVISYDSTGVVLRSEWSKIKVEEKKRFNDKLNKANKAFENALDKGDYSNIENIIKELAVKSNTKEESKPEIVSSE